MDPIPAAWLTQLQREPALWIRPKQALAQNVAEALGHCVRSNFSGLSTFTPQLSALHYTGLTDLYRTPGFQSGDFEIQDLASQLVGHACAPQPGETWWDACAGEGGKTMHLSDLMRNKGLIWVSDRSRPPPGETQGAGRARAGFQFPRRGVGRRRQAADENQIRRHSRRRALLGHRHLAAQHARALDHATQGRPRTRGCATAAARPRRRRAQGPAGASSTPCAPSRARDHRPRRVVHRRATPSFIPTAPTPISNLPTPITLWPQDLNAKRHVIASWKKDRPTFPDAPPFPLALPRHVRRVRQNHRRNVRADFNAIPAVIHYARAAHFIGLWKSERNLIESVFPRPPGPPARGRLRRGARGGRASGTRVTAISTAFDFAAELIDQAKSLANRAGQSPGSISSKPTPPGWAIRRWPPLRPSTARCSCSTA